MTIFSNTLQIHRVNSLPDDDSLDAMHFINEFLMPIKKLSDLHGAARQKQMYILDIVRSINTCPSLTR
jgi:hypothetical protein